MEINKKPTEKQLNQIKEWLKKEINETGEGFYNNWDIIENNFKRGKLIVFTKNKEYPIGFVVFDKEPLIVEIVIASIKPSERKKGYGREMINQLLEYFISKGVLISYLECAPASTERIWKKLEFINFPINFHSRFSTKLYRILVPVTTEYNELEFSKNDEIIELWDEQPHIENEIKVKWKWKLDYISNSQILKKPIIHPSNHKWQLEWKKGNLTKQKDKVQ